MPTVELSRVSMIFGNVVAVDEVDLRIEDGEYVTILGPSGCGKTTLIRMIAGIIEPTRGRGLHRRQGHERRPDRGAGHRLRVPEHRAVPEPDRPGQRLPTGRGCTGKEKEEQVAIAHKYLELVKLLDKMEMFPSELCGGEQQKVSLARALATGSKLLLLDEPLSALDARVRVDLRYELRRLVKRLGLTTVHVTHDQEEAMSVSDRIVLMRAGAIVEIGTPEQLYTRPLDIFTANFVGETNLFEGWVSHHERKDRTDRAP